MKVIAGIGNEETITGMPVEAAAEDSVAVGVLPKLTPRIPITPLSGLRHRQLDKLLPSLPALPVPSTDPSVVGGRSVSHTSVSHSVPTRRGNPKPLPSQVGGPRFVESSIVRDLHSMPGPGQYAAPSSGLGKQVSSFFKSSRAARFAPPTPPVHSHRRGDAADARRQAQVRLQRKMGSGRRAVEALVAMLDENGDGMIRPAELERGLLSLGMPLSKSDLQMLFHLYDVNGDGVIDLREIAEAVRA